MENLVDTRVQFLWNSVVHACNNVLRHAELYGFQLMELPDPNVRQIAKMFDSIVIPLLDELSRDYEFSAESGIKIANIKQYTMHLRGITIAIDNQDETEFSRMVDVLTAESMLL